METAIPPGQGPLGASVRRIGLWVLLLAALLPSHGCHSHPSEFDDDPGTSEAFGSPGDSFPVGRMEWFLQDKVFGLSWDEDSRWLPDSGNPVNVGWTVLFALPLWFAALLLIRGSRGDLRRSRVGGALVLVSVVALGAAVYGVLEGFDGISVKKGSAGFPPASAWSKDLQRVFLVSGSLFHLVARPRGRWGLRDVEAWIATQAQFGMAVVLYNPIVESAEWYLKEGYPLGAILQAQWINYKIGTPVTLLGLALVALPLYFSEERLRSLYDRRPWRSRSSTPTPTSISRHSTTTATRSSNGPGPPGSSPS